MIEINELFKHSNSNWIKYSDYEYKATPEGELYLTPTKDATIGMVNPLQSAENLLVDALNIGKLCMPEQPDMPQVKAQILAFAKQYGLMGFMVSYPMKLDFIEKKEVLLNSNPITDKSVMKTADYLKRFLPFGAEATLLTVRRMSLSLKLRPYRLLCLWTDRLFLRLYFQRITPRNSIG